MFRIYVERRPGFTHEADRIRSEAVDFLGVQGITAVRYFNRYDIENAGEAVCRAAAQRVFSEPQSDICTFTAPEISASDAVIIWEYLPGQYDQRADSAEQCLSLLSAAMQEAENADDEEYSSNITIQVDIWCDTPSECSSLAIEVNKKMRDMGFHRTLCLDLREEGAVKHHKTMRFEKEEILE